MNPVLLHLFLIIAGIAVALSALWYFARIRGGWFSIAGLLTVPFLVVAALLILAGFGVIGFPGLEAT